MEPTVIPIVADLAPVFRRDAWLTHAIIVPGALVVGWVEPGPPFDDRETRPGMMLDWRVTTADRGARYRAGSYGSGGSRDIPARIGRVDFAIDLDADFTIEVAWIVSRQPSILDPERSLRIPVRMP